MQQNILKDSSITKIFIIYVDNGMRKKHPVKLRFMDDKECYLASTNTLNFQKPKRKTDAELYVYTSDGVYKTKTKLMDTTVSINEVMFEVNLPKTWDYIQLRKSSRKGIELPVAIKFNDGFTIETTTYDLALGGISFFSKEELNSVYKKISGILTLKLPKGTVIDFPNGYLTVETKFVREVSDLEEHFDEKLYIFKFMSISSEEENILKNFLIKLD